MALVSVDDDRNMASRASSFSLDAISRRWRRVFRFSTVSEAKDDCFSKLEDKVLSRILSFLKERDLVRMSSVSRRWNRLSRSRSGFNFGFFSMFETRSWQEYFEDKPCRCSQYKDRYISGVNQYLQFNKSSEVSLFRIGFCLGRDSAQELDEWIRSAVRKGVSKLVLQLSCDSCPFTYGTYVFRPELLCEGDGPKPTFLCLRSCVLGRGLFDRLCSLKTLQLDRIVLEERDVKSILLSCLLLDYLLMSLCYLPDKLSIVGSDLQLKVLSVHACRVREVEISATSLIFIEYRGHEIDFSFLEVPKLETLYIREYVIHEVAVVNKLIRSLPSVKTLSIEGATDWVHDLPIKLNNFDKIKQLMLISPIVMDFDILKMSSILKACPQLEILRIMTKFCKGPMNLPFEYVHTSLKKVELGGFHRIWEQIEFVIYLLECAVALEQMIIDHRVQIYEGMDTDLRDEWLFIEMEEWDEQERAKIRGLLQGYLKNADLIML